MTRLMPHGAALVLVLSFSEFYSGCARRVDASTDRSGTGPVLTPVVQDLDPNHLKPDDPQKFPLVSAEPYVTAPNLNVTGVVSPDISRQVPVPSLATGRVIEVHARLGDAVQKGELLFKVRSSDVAGAFADYQKAVKNAQLAKVQLDRAQVLYDNGAVAKSLFEVAQTTEENARVDLSTTTERLRLLGVDPKNPTGIVEVYAPASGVITDQQITASSGVQALSAPNPFTISDMSKVWVVCDVYENNLGEVHVGEFADIRLNAYPERVFRARISNIMPMIDPTIRTGKVRLELDNPGLMRFGMFVAATFHGVTADKHVKIPATAVLHLHDRQWVYMPVENGAFKRVEIRAGNMISDKMQEVTSGLEPGERVIANALVFQNTVDQ